MYELQWTFEFLLDSIAVSLCLEANTATTPIPNTSKSGARYLLTFTINEYLFWLQLYFELHNKISM